MTIRPVGGQLLLADGQRTDRQTDLPNLIVAFCNFANAPKNWHDTLFCFYKQESDYFRNVKNLWCSKYRVGHEKLARVRSIT